MEEHQKLDTPQENHGDHDEQPPQTSEQDVAEMEVVSENHTNMIDELHNKFNVRKRKTTLGQQLETEQIGSGSYTASKNRTNLKLSLVENCSFWALVISALIIILKFVYLLVWYIKVS